MSRIFLGIDPQRSFGNVNGELYVPGADKDMERLGHVVETVDFDDVIITLDSHEFLHISHPIWFKFADEEEICHPEPFTRMCIENGEIVGYMQDKCVGQFKTTIESLQKWTVEYIQKLTDKGIPHIIWVPHCIMGTKGHNIVPSFMKGVLAWERKRIVAGKKARAFKIMKGRSIYTEHFSAIRPVVRVPFDAEKTGINNKLLDRLSLHSITDIVVGGEAWNFCVGSSLTDIVKLCGWRLKVAKKIILLTDGTSEVPNCGDLGKAFMEDLIGRGMRKMTCEEYIEMAAKN